MELLTSYQYELTGVLIALVLLYMLILFKRKQKSLTLEDEFLESEVTLNTESGVDESTETTQEEEPSSSDEPVEPEEKQQNEQTQTEQKSTPEKTPLKKRAPYKKRDVPPHQKITKEDFRDFKGLRVLIAEDNLINQKVIQGLLTESGIELVMADDGMEVLEILEHDDDFSLILMDVHMPRLNGFEATKKIRMNPAYNHIAIIALSGDTASDDVKKMRDAGMADHIEKPLKMDALYDIFYAYSNLDDKLSFNNSLDVEEGLYICGDDKEFYKDILQEFLHNYQESADELKKLLKANNLQDADKLLLDIIGVAANIGAIKLTKIAQQLKVALHNNQEQAQRLLQSYSTELTTLNHTISTYLQDK